MKGKKGMTYTDAAAPIGGIAAIAVVDKELNICKEAVIKCRNTTEAEKIAVALAATDKHSEFILTNLQTPTGTSPKVELIPKWQEC